MVGWCMVLYRVLVLSFFDLVAKSLSNFAYVTVL